MHLAVAHVAFAWHIIWLTFDSYPTSHVTFASDAYVVLVVFRSLYAPFRMTGVEPQSTIENTPKLNLTRQA
jgi:hypothetical protein